MSIRTLIVAPHADDELLGCGGSLLRRNSEGGVVGWVLVTSIIESSIWSRSRILRRKDEIEYIRKALSIDNTHLYQLNFPATQLDQVPMNILVPNLMEVFNSFKPEEVLVPHPGDVHSDHRNTFDVAIACTKWFRSPSVKRVMTYETLSETDAGLDEANKFTPNFFIDISPYLESKLQLLNVYGSEISTFPFPRSRRAIKALAEYRGSQSGFHAAEAFSLLREREILASD